MDFVQFLPDDWAFDEQGLSEEAGRRQNVRGKPLKRFGIVAVAHTSLKRGVNEIQTRSESTFASLPGKN